MPVFKLEAEDGTWLTDIRVSAPNWKPGDRIPRGRDALEVVRVRHDSVFDPQIWLVSIGVPGFEPGTSCPPDKRANQAAPHPVRLLEPNLPVSSSREG